MKRLLVLSVVVVIIFSLGSIARATSLSFTVTPDDLADGATFLNGQGGVMFGYDPDMPPPIALDVPGPAGFGTSCFYSDVQGSAVVGSPRDYTSFRMSPKDIFGMTDVTIGDLLTVSYWTKRDTLSPDLDWRLSIYGNVNRKFPHRACRKFPHPKIINL